ncbi:inorganic pyrophosphatase [Candidatus Falkowbacteria bacterium]|nr:inorganic pyrophosphatase [Candidatus Falkowbacteria bacterium]
MDNIYHFINKKVHVRIHRPLGSSHPKYEFVYPVNYGRIPNTEGSDGKEMNAYILGVDEPLAGMYEGKCIAVIHRTDDPDDKLIIVPLDVDSMSDPEIREATNFQEQHYSSVIIRDPETE